MSRGARSQYGIRVVSNIICYVVKRVYIVALSIPRRKSDIRCRVEYILALYQESSRSCSYRRIAEDLYGRQDRIIDITSPNILN
jgi:hypothetical protein